MFKMTHFMLPVVCTSVIFTPFTANAGQIYRREIQQEQRIYYGVRNRQISPRAYRNFQKRRVPINTQRQRYLRLNQRRFIPNQYRGLNQRFDRNSRLIYIYKHN